MSEPFNPFSLAGKRILVTGASSGIGRCIAILCSRMHSEVVLNGRNVGRLEETLDQMEPGNHIVVSADLTDDAQRGEIVSQMPFLDGIVYCAGVMELKPAKFIVGDDIDKVMRTNFEAPVLLQAELQRAAKIKKNASIVFIASRAFEAPSVGNSIYSASKGAIVSYAKCLSLELAPRKTRVNCICPGMVWTELLNQGTMEEANLKKAEDNYPLKRFGTPDDVANLCVFLLSDASSWMTGSVIDITGGAYEHHA